MNQRGGRGNSGSRGRSPRPDGGRPPHFRAPAGADGHPVDDSLGHTDGMFRGGRTNPQQRSQGGVSKHFEQKLVYRQKQPAYSGSPGFSDAVRHQSSASPTGSVSKLPESAVQSREDGLYVPIAQSVPKGVCPGVSELQNGDKIGYSATLHDFSEKVNVTSQQDESRLHSGHSEQGRRTNSHQRPHDGFSNHFEPKPFSGNKYRPKRPAYSASPGYSNIVRHQSSASPTGSVSKQPESAASILPREDGLHVPIAQSVPKDVCPGVSELQNGDKMENSPILHHDFSEKVNVTSQQDESRLHSNSGAGVGGSLNKGMKNTAENGDSGLSDHGGRKNSHQRPHVGVSNHFEPKPFSGNTYRQNRPAFRGSTGFSNVVRNQQGQSSANPTGSVSKPPEPVASVLPHEYDLSVNSSRPVPKDAHLGARDSRNGDQSGYSSALPHDLSEKMEVTSQQDESRIHCKSGAGVGDSLDKGPKNTEDIGDSGHSEDAKEIACFDLCPSKGSPSIKLQPSLLEKNKEKRNEIKRSSEGQHGSILRPGMVLLKKFLSLNDQVKIVKQCRGLGIGRGGFYQPGYGDGKEQRSKMHLKMMCLGKNWDPEMSTYVDFRPHDRATPPKIPDLLSQYVLKAMEDSHALIRKESKGVNVRNVLPSMSPDICIVNFYPSSGKLGLHRDKDETSESLKNGLPVVSFSIGDSAEFLYGDECDVDKATKVVLESGDLLIFGGKSRHIFHGVTSILPNTAPKALLDESNLRPGRLNLTFRKY